MKVTCIEEAQDMKNMKVEELIGSLQTFEMDINDRTEKKHKSIVFLSNINNEQAQSDLETNEGIFDAMIFLGRQFNNILKKMDRKRGPNVKNISFDVNKNNESQRKDRNDDKTN